MPSETDIINISLRMIGGTAISARTDGSTNANIVDDLYDDLRDALLRAHNWNFATKRQKLAKLSTAPAFEFDNAFGMPSDWLKTVSVHDNDAGAGTIMYRMELTAGVRSILTNTETCYLRYISQVTDTNIMSSDFRWCLAHSLASNLSLPVAGSNTMQQNFQDSTDRILGSTKAKDAQGAFPEIRPRGTWADSRGGYSTVWPQ